METIINVDDVSFSYGTQTEQALKHISLGVNRGDFIGIIGPSGAGKSTLPPACRGAVPHHYTGTFFGSVTVDGNDTCEVSLTDVSQIVGSVFQGHRHANGRLGRRGRDAIWHRELWRSRPNRATCERNARNRRHQRPVRPRDRHPLRRPKAKGCHRRHPHHASARARARRTHRGARPRQLHAGLRTLREANRALGITIVVVEQKVALLSGIATACSCSIMAKSRYRASRTRSSRTPMSSAPSALIAACHAHFQQPRADGWPAALPVWMLMRPNA